MLQLQKDLELAEHLPRQAMVLSDAFRARIHDGKSEGVADAIPGEKQAEG